MNRILEYMAKDHERLDHLLNRSMASLPEVNRELYKQFRIGLLRHIGIEEKILIPAIRQLAGREHPDTARIRLDHGAIAALLVPPPDGRVITVLKAILEGHNAREESPAGIYSSIPLGDAESLILFEAMLSFPDVPLSPAIDSPNVLDATRRAVERAGYDFDHLSK
jgi:hypothetical protein